MSREEEIRDTAEGRHNYQEDVDSFIDGAEWADAHPSEETIKRIVDLFNNYDVIELDTRQRQVEWLKEHFND